MDLYKLEEHAEGFKKLASERLPDGLWSSLHDAIIGMLSVHLLGRLTFRLYSRIVELERRIEKLEAKQPVNVTNVTYQK